MSLSKLLLATLGLTMATGLWAADGKFLADRHAQKGIQCQMCHDDVTKGTMKTNKDRHEACVECHGWYDAVAKKTQPENPEEMNPHSQHDGNLPCTTCHKGHKAGENYCGNCHYYTFTVP